ncbi:hypothetical protein TNIN_89391 [Trichonephila inaurata madagascariensis]|uniref:Uncharacterized protein n=1 Tax=Trichonephila inaurata madagascariensis TaxID=2747483 RepID=A0A8X7CJL4_9ARAC|nr:hypothetical protein TNIN_89391 [Trichonephila inaurata madagascariensis]
MSPPNNLANKIVRNFPGPHPLLPSRVSKVAAIIPALIVFLVQSTVDNWPPSRYSVCIRMPASQSSKHISELINDLRLLVDLVNIINGWI